MVTNDQLQAELALAKAIPTENVQTPNLPIVDCLQEAGDLISVSEQDRAMLETVNIDWEKATRLEAAIELLRDAQTQWMEMRKDADDAREEWNKVYPKAEGLIKDILQTMRFVYDGDEEALKRVSEIAAGGGYRDTIQDLHDVAYKAKLDLAPFEAINYDVALFDEAERLSNGLMLLLGRMNGERNNDHELKTFRDRAYTNLKELMDYIRKYGKYVFRNDKGKAESYSSNYHRH